MKNKYLDDFTVENKDRPAESLVGSYHVESTDQRTTRSGITTKIPPFLMEQRPGFGTRSRSMTGWILQFLKQKSGPTLKNRLVGDAEMCKGLLDREPLRAVHGTK